MTIVNTRRVELRMLITKVEFGTAIGAVTLRVIGFMVALLVAGSLSRVITSWDGSHFIDIARSGYPIGQPLSASFRLAFFPLWPALLALLVRLPVDLGVVVVAFGVVSTLVSAVLLQRLLVERIGAREATLVTLLWAALPPNWVYLSAYSESLFVVIELLLLLSMQRRSHRAVAVFALLIGLCRPQGLIWAAAAALWMMRSNQRVVTRVIGACVALAGFALWQIAVSVATGIPFGWFAVEALPGWGQGVGVAPFAAAIDAIAALPTGVIDRRIAMIPIMIGTAAALVLLIRRRRLMLGTWPTIASTALVFFLAGGIGSIPRYISGAPLILLGVTKYLSGSKVREAVAVGLLLAASVALSFYNLSIGGSNP